SVDFLLVQHCLVCQRPLPVPYLHSFPTRRSSDLFVSISSIFSPVLPRDAVLSVRVRRMQRQNRRPTFSLLLQNRFGHQQRSRHRSEEHTSELQSRETIVCRLLRE